MSGFEFDRVTGISDAVIFRNSILAVQDASPFGGNSSVEVHHIIPVQAFDDADVRLQIQSAAADVGRTSFSVNDPDNMLILPRNQVAQVTAATGNPPIFASMHSGSDATHIRYNNFAVTQVKKITDDYKAGLIEGAELFERLDNLQSVFKQSLTADSPNKLMFFLDSNDTVMASQLDADPNSNTIDDFYDKRIGTLSEKIDLSRPSTIISLDGDIGAAFRYADGSVTPVLNLDINADLATRFNKILDGSGAFEKLAIAVLAVGFIGQADSALAATYGDDYELNDVMDFIGGSTIPVEQLAEVLPDLAEGAAIDVGLSIAASALGVGLLWKAYELWESFDGLEAAFEYASDNTDSSVIQEVSDGLSALKTRLDSWFGSDETPTGRVQLTEEETIEAFLALPDPVQAKVLEVLNDYFDLRFDDAGYTLLADALTAARIYGAAGEQGISFYSILEAAFALSDEGALYDLSRDMGFRECFPAGTMVAMWPHGGTVPTGADGMIDQAALLDAVWHKPIELVTAKDIIVAHDSAGDMVPGEVVNFFTNTTQEFVRLSFDDGRDDLVATPGHRFLSETGDFMEIGHMLRLGGGSVRLVETNGKVVTARGELLTYGADTADLFEQAEAKATVFEGNLAVKQDAQAGWATYNFEVREHHTYIAGGIRVHNDSVLSFLSEGDTVLALNDNLTDMAIIRDVDGDGVDQLVILDGYRDPANGVFDTRIEIANVYTPPAGTDIASVLGGIIDTNPNDLSANPLDPGLGNGYGDGVVSDDLDEVVFDDLGWSVTRTVNGAGVPSEDAILANPLMALSVIQPVIDVLNAVGPDAQSYNSGAGDVVTPPYQAPDGTALLAAVLGINLDFVIVPAVVIPGPFGDIEVTPAVTLGSLVAGLVSLPTDITLEFGPGIIIDDVTRAQDGDDLVLTIDNGDGTTNTWTLEGIYADGDTSEIASVIFADGTELSLDEISDGSAVSDGIVTGTEGADIIDTAYLDAESEGVTAGDDVVLALGGDDTVSTGAGNDTITGGTGNNTLDGGEDDDTAIYLGGFQDYEFGLGDGGSGFTMTDVAGVSGTDTLISIESLSFGDGSTGLVSMASGETRINVFEADGTTRSGYIRLDTSGSRDWESFVTVFGDNETIVSQVVDDDDGVLNATSFVAGVRNKLAIEDADNAYSWTSEVRSYDETGTITSSVLTYDDGRVSDTTYVNGIRSEEVFSDIDDVLSWTSRTRTYDEQGVITSQVVNDDDGLILETTYVAGVRTQLETQDAGDAFIWQTEVLTYDETGALTDEALTYDDGRVRDTTFVDGLRTTEKFTDVPDVVSWETRTRTYNEDGSLASQLVAYDDGQSNETLYVDGVRDMQTIEDVDDMFAWNTRVRDFDGTGTLTTETTTYDDGRVFETTYQGGVRASRSDTDVEDAFSWATRETLYDLDGDRVSITTVFDDGGETARFFDDSPMG